MVFFVKIVIGWMSLTHYEESKEINGLGKYSRSTEGIHMFMLFL
jgi:hypothetical protein